MPFAVCLLCAKLISGSEVSSPVLCVPSTMPSSTCAWPLSCSACQDSLTHWAPEEAEKRKLNVGESWDFSMLSFFIFPCLFICPRLNVGHPFFKRWLNTDYVLSRTQHMNVWSWTSRRCKATDINS